MGSSTGNSCEFLQDCHFYDRFEQAEDHCCSRFVHVYCTGPISDRCEKRRYRLLHGRPPGTGMIPTGETGGFSIP